MSVWNKPPNLEPPTISSEKINEDKPVKNNIHGIVPQEVSCGLGVFKTPLYDKHIYESCHRVREIRREEDMIVWMRYYDFHLKNMYGIFLSSLKRYNIRTRLSFDEFRVYVYSCTIARLDPYIHKRVRPLI